VENRLGPRNIVRTLHSARSRHHRRGPTIRLDAFRRIGSRALCRLRSVSYHTGTACRGPNGVQSWNSTFIVSQHESIVLAGWVRLVASNDYGTVRRANRLAGKLITRVGSGYSVAADVGRPSSSDLESRPVLVEQASLMHEPDPSNVNWCCGRPPIPSQHRRTRWSFAGRPLHVLHVPARSPHRDYDAVRPAHPLARNAIRAA
jgi:hypothetical protein